MKMHATQAFRNELFRWGAGTGAGTETIEMEKKVIVSIHLDCKLKINGEIHNLLPSK